MKKRVPKILCLITGTLLTPLVFSQALQPWMSPEVTDAWKSGFKGQGTTITFVDDFNSKTKLFGSFDGVRKSQQHGKFTSHEASLIAPLATIRTQDFNNGTPIGLSASGLNIINLSYASYNLAGYSINQIGWNNREQSIINHAMNGNAVIAKAAGNDYGTAVGASNKSGKVDYLNVALINTKSAIFAGALDKNGTTANKANMANYSNVAGTNTAVQNKFLVVGVTGGSDPYYKLYGTSFAAPVISGYSAILGSKFTTASAPVISNQLLNTARTDTINNYNANIHGKGEASITRALAPVAIK